MVIQVVVGAFEISTAHMNLLTWEETPAKERYQMSVGFVTQLCLTLCDPVECNLPGSSVHGIFQAKIVSHNTLCVQGVDCGILEN